MSIPEKDLQEVTRSCKTLQALLTWLITGVSPLELDAGAHRLPGPTPGLASLPGKRDELTAMQVGFVMFNAGLGTGQKHPLKGCSIEAVLFIV